MINENGDLPAASLHPATNPHGASAGLTKREHFAALAMQGLLANSYGDSWNREQKITQVAKQAIEYTDELLKQLEQRSK